MPAGRSVADIGTGDGKLAAWLALRGQRIALRLRRRQRFDRGFHPLVAGQSQLEVNPLVGQRPDPVTEPLVLEKQLGRPHRAVEYGGSKSSAA